jgi:hypothetical protein
MKIDHLIRLGRVDPILEEDANGIEMLTGWRRKNNPRSRSVLSEQRLPEWRLKHAQPWIVHGQLTPGVKIVLAERKRQMQMEGFDAARDDAYTGGELARAAQCYELPHEKRNLVMKRTGEVSTDPEDSVPLSWPWPADWWKPGDRIRELAKAGALYLAEAERLTRAGEPEKAALVQHQALGCASGIDNLYKVTPLSPGPHMLGKG